MLAAYLDQTSRNFFAEQEYGQVNTGDLFNRRTRFGCRWAVCWENETFCGLYREVRAIRRRHFADTVSIFVAERFFLKKTGDSVVAGELLFVVCSEERNRAPLKRRSGWDFSGGSVPRNA
ncbi:MAG: hypothetical protein DMG41_33190 [Acidobacteria bacterium]|nr:MAG: hypothetical protein AUH13_21335 [Acidobacteria bacterium 13_2_20CM_58_27]PYT82422.1 MAG: hypothetical protein DMG41_33190 [Acidobacteriota bacterium]